MRQDVLIFCFVAEIAIEVASAGVFYFIVLYFVAVDFYLESGGAHVLQGPLHALVAEEDDEDNLQRNVIMDVELCCVVQRMMMCIFSRGFLVMPNDEDVGVVSVNFYRAAYTFI